MVAAVAVNEVQRRLHVVASPPFQLSQPEVSHLSSSRPLTLLEGVETQADPFHVMPVAQQLAPTPPLQSPTEPAQPLPKSLLFTGGLVPTSTSPQPTAPAAA